MTDTHPARESLVPVPAASLEALRERAHACRRTLGVAAPMPGEEWIAGNCTRFGNSVLGWFVTTGAIYCLGRGMFTGRNTPLSVRRIGLQNLGLFDPFPNPAHILRRNWQFSLVLFAFVAIEAAIAATSFGGSGGPTTAEWFELLQFGGMNLLGLGLIGWFLFEPRVRFTIARGNGEAHWSWPIPFALTRSSRRRRAAALDQLFAAIREAERRAEAAKTQERRAREAATREEPGTPGADLRHAMTEGWLALGCTPPDVVTEAGETWIDWDARRFRNGMLAWAVTDRAAYLFKRGGTDVHRVPLDELAFLDPFESWWSGIRRRPFHAIVYLAGIFCCAAFLVLARQMGDNGLDAAFGSFVGLFLSGLCGWRLFLLGRRQLAITRRLGEMEQTLRWELPEALWPAERKTRAAALERLYAAIRAAERRLDQGPGAGSALRPKSN